MTTTSILTTACPPWTTPDGDGSGLDLLCDLVATPSTSGHERAAVELLVGWMCRRGFDAYIDEVGNAVGILDGGPGPDGAGTSDIVLLGHIDTVHGFPPVALRDGKLYGRGAVDAKGPLAAFAWATVQAGPRPGWRIVVIGAVEEEAATSRGARHAVQQFSPALAVVGEPSGWQRVTLGYKGRLLCQATVRQSLSHRSGRQLSAAERALEFWGQVGQRIAALNAGRERPWDQVLSTLRGFSSGDDGLTETARLEMGFRLPPDVGPEQLVATLNDMGGEVELSFAGAETAYRAPKDTVLVRSFLRAIREEGGQPSFVLKTGTSDMNVVGPVWNCPIVAYGPGDSSLDHTPEEHVVLAEWEQGAAVLARVLTAI